MRKRYLISIAVLILSCFLIVGCGFSTVATVNGEKIAQSMVDQQTRFYIADYEYQYKLPFEKDKSKLLYQKWENNAKSDLIRQNLLLAEAQKRGLKVTDEDVNKSLEVVKAMLGNDKKNKGYEKYLETLKMNETEFKEALKKQMLAGKVEDEVTKDVTVTDAEVTEYYQQHKAEYKKLLPEIKADVTADALKAKKEKVWEEFGGNLQKAAKIEVK